MPSDTELGFLEISEHLIEAHKLAKIAGNETSLALIEAALFYVGEQLKSFGNSDARIKTISPERGGSNNGDS